MSLIRLWENGHNFCSFDKNVNKRGEDPLIIVRIGLVYFGHITEHKTLIRIDKTDFRSEIFVIILIELIVFKRGDNFFKVFLVRY